MPIVSELYGHKINTEESRKILPDAFCIHMKKRCNGGGNRDMANASLVSDSGLRARFSPEVMATGFAACAICSVRVGGKSCIICPNRLFYIGQHGFSGQQTKLIKFLCGAIGFRKGDKIAVWKEVSVNSKNNGNSFNYRLDYLFRKIVGNSYGPPIIIEVMTCSTSGGNKKKGTDIATAFKKAVLSDGTKDINSPGVNIRQVWARMASQLIVKSQLGAYWGGQTIWVIQDVLAEYINSTTGLDLDGLKSNNLNEVNIVSTAGSGDSTPILFSGPISNTVDDKPSFSDILKAPFLPEFENFERTVPEYPVTQFVCP